VFLPLNQVQNLGHVHVEPDRIASSRVDDVELIAWSGKRSGDVRVDPAALDQGGEWEIRRVSQAGRTWNSGGGERDSQVPEGVVDHGCRVAKAEEVNERRKKRRNRLDTQHDPVSGDA
jgi:hypothetical protein